MTKSCYIDLKHCCRGRAASLFLLQGQRSARRELWRIRFLGRGLSSQLLLEKREMKSNDLCSWEVSCVCQKSSESLLPNLMPSWASSIHSLHFGHPRGSAVISSCRRPAACLLPFLHPGWSRLPCFYCSSSVTSWQGLIGSGHPLCPTHHEALL